MNRKVAEEIAVTWELLNGPISDPAMKILLRQLSQYEDTALLKALARCRSECKGRITPADIISRIDDGRPSPDEAWAIASIARKDEDATIVWSEEIASAYGAVRFMDDEIAARMAFKDAYKRACDESRADNRLVKWHASLGSYDGRSGPMMEAVRLGRLPEKHARRICPELPPMGQEERLLPTHEEPDPRELSELCQEVISNCNAKLGE